jgi:dihydrofolate reductase
MAELKRSTGGDIVIYGSLSVIQSLVEQHLVDEFHFLVHPTILRRGKALLDGSQPPALLSLASVEPFSSGVVLMKYRQLDSTL